MGPWEDFLEEATLVLSLEGQGRTWAGRGGAKLSEG